MEVPFRKPGLSDFLTQQRALEWKHVASMPPSGGGDYSQARYPTDVTHYRACHGDRGCGSNHRRRGYHP